MAREPAAGIRVINPGVLTLVQDLGRFGYQHLGLSPGGAADEHAFLWANRLLGNAPGSAQLEICLGGLQLQAEVATRMAITGADLQATLNGRALTPWQTFAVTPGDRLHFGHPRGGVRGYLAVQGGFGIAPTFGSVSTVMREQIGGLDGWGRPLAKGDFLPCTEGTGPSLRVPWRYLPDYHQPLVLRVIAIDQSEAVGAGLLKNLFQSAYQISAQSDRMGVRLSGEALRPPQGGIVSEGLGFGTVQIPPDGQPIIMLKDRQTIGGYPKLGTVFPLDAFALSQRQPHTTVTFEPVALNDAQGRLARFYRFFGV